MPKKKTHEEFVRQALALSCDVLERYEGNRQRILVRCTICGHERRIRCDHLIDGRMCIKCLHASLCKTQDAFRSELLSVGVRPIGEYKNRSTAVSVECIECGHVWSGIPEHSKWSCVKCIWKDARKPPAITDYGDYGEITVDGSFVQISKEDFSIIDRSVRLDRNGYPEIRGVGWIHKIIMGDKDRMVDHIDRNPLNNRRENLRYVTKSQNAMNSKVRSDSKTGLRGISYNKRKQTWNASIHKDGKNYFLGSYYNVDLAVGARRQAELELFGEYAPKPMTLEQECV